MLTLAGCNPIHSLRSVAVLAGQDSDPIGHIREARHVPLDVSSGLKRFRQRFISLIRVNLKIVRNRFSKGVCRVSVGCRFCFGTQGLRGYPIGRLNGIHDCGCYL